MKRRLEIGQRNVEKWVEELAWKKLGWGKGYTEVLKEVRELSLEDKVDMLVALHIHEMAHKQIERKEQVLLDLGHRTWVEGDEVYDLVKATYTDTDDVTWIVDRHDFYSVHIDPHSGTLRQLNTTGKEKLKRRREGKE